MTDSDILVADWRSMSVANATVTDDAEYITRELCDVRDENRTLDDYR